MNAGRNANTFGLSFDNSRSVLVGARSAEEAKPELWTLCQHCPRGSEGVVERDLDIFLLAHRRLRNAQTPDASVGTESASGGRVVRKVAEDDFCELGVRRARRASREDRDAFHGWILAATRNNSFAGMREWQALLRQSPA
jgi:hypothetical protein